MIGVWHPIVAITVQLALGVLTGDYWLGVAFSFIFFGREHAQAEYRWIEMYGHGLRGNMPWWGGFDRRTWNIHSLTDCSLPLLATLFIGIFGALRH